MRGRRFINLMSTSATPSWVMPGAAIDLDFANGRYFGGTLASLLSITRASNATDLLPSSASGYAYNTFSSNILAISPNVGLLIFEARTNLLLNSNAPVTQTTASLGTGTYTLGGNGAGSSLASGGTATITGAAPATNGNPNTFTVTVAGTVTVTVTGSLNAFQLEAGAFGTSFIVTAGATAARAADAVLLSGAFTSLVAAAQGSLVVATSNRSRPVSSGGTIIGSNSSNMDLLESDVSDHLTAFNGSSVLQTANMTTWSGVNKSGIAWSGTSRSLVLNNSAVATDANSANTGAQTGFLLGNRSGGPWFDGTIGRVTAWNTRLPDATLKALTL